jgi:hypothetical protein
MKLFFEKVNVVNTISAKPTTVIPKEAEKPMAKNKTNNASVKNHAAQILRAQGNQSLYMHKNAQILTSFYGPLSNPKHTNVTKRMQQLHKRTNCIDLPEINLFFKNPFPKMETILTIYFQNSPSSSSSKTDEHTETKITKNKNSKLAIAASTHRLKPDEQLLAEMENKQVTF